MRQVALAGGDFSVPRFIFGTASLFRLGLQRGRRADLIAAALDHGFTHFDTSPYYGFGMAERDLGAVLGGDLGGRAAATITSKVGLYAPGAADAPAAAILARKAAGRIAPALSRPVVDWSVARGRRSLDDSLVRLRRERIEVLLLHEPDAALIDTQEWRRWLEDEVAAGRVGRFGLGGAAARLADFVAAGSPLADILQTGDSQAGREADALARLGRPAQITYGYVSAALRRGEADVATVLAQALQRNRHGAIVVSTRKTERLALLARLAEGHAPAPA